MIRELPVDRLRSEIPGLTLRTTVIVGFPGEGDDEFQENLDLVGTVTRALIDYVEEGGPLSADGSGALPGVARTEGQASDVDGVTYVHPHPSLRPRELVSVKVVDALEYDLVAEVVDGPPA